MMDAAELRLERAAFEQWLQGEGGRMEFPDRKAATEYADRYCAAQSGWKACSVAASLLRYYERKEDQREKRG